MKSFIVFILLCFSLNIHAQWKTNNAEKKAIKLVQSLPEIRGKNNFLFDSQQINNELVSVDLYDTINTIISFQDTYVPGHDYCFHVNIKTKQIFFYDWIEDKLLTLSEWRKYKNL